MPDTPPPPPCGGCHADSSVGVAQLGGVGRPGWGCRLPRGGRPASVLTDPHAGVGGGIARRGPARGGIRGGDTHRVAHPSPPASTGLRSPLGDLEHPPPTTPPDRSKDQAAQPQPPPLLQSRPPPCSPPPSPHTGGPHRDPPRGASHTRRARRTLPRRPTLPRLRQRRCGGGGCPSLGPRRGATVAPCRRRGEGRVPPPHPTPASKAARPTRCLRRRGRSHREVVSALSAWAGAPPHHTRPERDAKRHQARHTTGRRVPREHPSSPPSWRGGHPTARCALAVRGRGTCAHRGAAA